MNTQVHEEVEKIRAERTAKAERGAAKRLKWAGAALEKAEAVGTEADRLASAIPFGQPILIGHYSEKGDRGFRGRIQSKYAKESELRNKADYHTQKAENILKYGSRVRGDAERERQSKRDALDAAVSIGMKVRDAVFGEGEVTRINRKSYTLKFASGWTCARDKSYVKV